jgi:uncharacterized protein (TIGR03118 family)
MSAKSNRVAIAARACVRSACVEILESRRLLSGTVLQTNLVSDLPGVAAVTDPNLVNPWGIAESPSTPSRPGSPFWISDNNAGVSSLYSVPGANNTPVSINGLVVSIPSPGDPLGASGTPTGAVFNLDGGMTGGFKVSGFTKSGTSGTPGTPTSASAIFLFDTEDGTIVGWNPGVNPTPNAANPGTYGIIPPSVDNSGNNFTEPNPALQTGAVYKGLTMAQSANPIFSADPASTTVLYATNFRAGTVEAYDPNFNPISLNGVFSDPNLPDGYAPFNIQTLGGKIYVTYAKQDDLKHDDVPGPGRGFVDVFNLDGTPGLAGGVVRLATRGELNAPWGLAIAPASFGSFAGDLLVGNFGDGFINIYNPSTPGASLGQLTDPDGEAIQIDGLWALRVGNGGNGGSLNDVYFTAGLSHETHGLFGSLAPVAAGTPEGPAETQLAVAALDAAQLNLTTLQNDIAANASASQIRTDAQAFELSVDDLIRADRTLRRDIRSDGGTDPGAASADASIDSFLDSLHKFDHDFDG